MICACGVCALGLVKLSLQEAKPRHMICCMSEGARDLQAPAQRSGIWSSMHGASTSNWWMQWSQCSGIWLEPQSPFGSDGGRSSMRSRQATFMWLSTFEHIECYSSESQIRF